MTTANEVRGARARLGWTLAQLAEALGVSLRAVQHWEAGTRRPPPHVGLALDRLIELHAPRRTAAPRKTRRS